MKRITVSVYINLLIVSILCAQSGSAGSSGFSSLKLGAGARAGAMGEAYTAVSDDATSTYWNPAGLATIKNVELFFTHTEWVEDISHEFLSAALPAFNGAVAFSFYSTNIPGIERRVRPSELPLGTIEANDIAASLSYGRSINDKLSAGISVKYIYQKIFVESASGYAMDFGLIYKPLQNPLKIAVVVQNLGSLKKLKEEEVELPQTFKFGGAYEINFPSLGGTLLLAVDAVKIKDSDIRAFLGGEFSFKQNFSLRLGRQTGESAKSFSAGVGFRLDRYRLDYGFTPLQSDLGNTHKFSISLNL